jgi:DNA-binding Lrp family transcriptional regulator
MHDSSPGRREAKPRSLWPAARLLVDFVMDVAEIARGGGSILDVLIVTVIVDANVAGFAFDGDLQRTYATLAAPPPDALRRPVTISTVAAAAGLPYETVRRRVGRLARAGECVVGPEGVIVPTARLVSPAYVLAAEGRYRCTRELYEALVGAGILRRDDPESPRARQRVAASGSEAPVRLCNRLLSEYYLRMMKLMIRQVGDPVNGLILLGVARANMAGQAPDASAAAAFLPGGSRRPASRSLVACQLGIPHETVRRRLIELEARGYCRAVRRGVVVDVRAVRHPDAIELFRRNQRHLLRLFARLRRSGVLDYWDTQSAR